MLRDTCCDVSSTTLIRDEDEEMSHAGVSAAGPSSDQNRRPPIHLQAHPSCLMTLPTVTCFEQESQDRQQQQEEEMKGERRRGNTCVK